MRHLAAVLTTTLLLAGCGGGGDGGGDVGAADRKAAQAVADDFVQALALRDGRLACERLTRDAAAELTRLARLTEGGSASCGALFEEDGPLDATGVGAPPAAGVAPPVAVRDGRVTIGRDDRRFELERAGRGWGVDLLATPVPRYRVTASRACTGYYDRGLAAPLPAADRRSLARALAGDAARRSAFADALQAVEAPRLVARAHREFVAVNRRLAELDRADADAVARRGPTARSLGDRVDERNRLFDRSDALREELRITCGRHPAYRPGGQALRIAAEPACEQASRRLRAIGRIEDDAEADRFIATVRRLVARLRRAPAARGVQARVGAETLRAHEELVRLFLDGGGDDEQLQLQITRVDRGFAALALPACTGLY